MWVNRIKGYTNQGKIGNNQDSMQKENVFPVLAGLYAKSSPNESVPVTREPYSTTTNLQWGNH